MRRASRALAIFLLFAFLLSCLPAVTRADDGSSDMTSDDGDDVGVEIERPELELSSDCGTVGTKVYVTIHGFTANESVEVYFSDITEPVKTWPTDDYGYLKTGFRVPEYPAGRYRIVANDGTNNLHLFFELESEITVDKTSGYVGESVTVTGTGFCDDDEVKLYLDGGLMGEAETDAQGSFCAICTVPESSNGTHIIKAEDLADNYATTEFDTGQAICIEPAEGAPTTELLVSGSGFNASTSVAISFGDQEIGIAHTGSDGSFSASLTVPGGASGVYEVKADDGDVRDYASFTLSSVARLSVGGDFVGAQLGITGNGFLPDSDIAVTYDGRQVARSSAGGTGAFTITFPAPAGSHGEHTVSVTDGVNSATMTFTMESTPPSPPFVITPSDGGKLAKQLYFDWEDVPDPSGTMYQFEMATDAQFADVVLSERALLTSEYMLTGDTPLVGGVRGGGYYWRVKAVDFAGNESQWSTTRYLEAGFTFEMPSWALFSLIAIGAVFALFLVGWFLRTSTGRRHGDDVGMPDSELGVDDVF